MADLAHLRHPRDASLRLRSTAWALSTQMSRTLPLAVAILVAAFATTSAVAQSRPELSDLPEGRRIRIKLLSPNPSAHKPDTISGTATIRRADADSIVFQMDRSDSLRVAPWWQVRELDVSDGRRPYTALEHLSSTAMITLIGVGVSYSWWHSCNDPESDVIWSCIVAPRHLGTSVRFGAWAGLALGVIDVFTNRYEELWRNVVRSNGPSLLIDHQARSGFRFGVNFRF